MGLGTGFWICREAEFSIEGTQISSDLREGFAARIHGGQLVSRWDGGAVEHTQLFKAVYDDTGQWRCDKSLQVKSVIYFFCSSTSR